MKWKSVRAPNTIWILEKYSRVTHTVVQLSETRQARYSGFDARIASLNTGTLPGAPRIEAVQKIEEVEQYTRGYYGGSMCWLLFNGDVNSAITIRTAHVRVGGLLSFSVGTMVLYESVPDNALWETRIKAAAFIAAVEGFLQFGVRLQVAPQIAKSPYNFTSFKAAPPPFSVAMCTT